MEKKNVNVEAIVIPIVLVFLLVTSIIAFLIFRRFKKEQKNISNLNHFPESEGSVYSPISKVKKNNFF